MAPPRLPAAILLTALLTATAPGQGEQPPDVPLPYAHDSGAAANDSDRVEAVISFAVSVPGASSLRLYFDAVELAGAGRPDASLLRLTSHADGAVQLMRAEHVRQWRGSSAYFNGDRVQVEVIAHPGTGENRVALRSVDVGVTTIASQCGPDDDRVPSNDPRVARILPVACTAWMIDDCAACFLSAGHCSGAFALVEFNVPFSTPSGSFVHPGPEDQYAVDVDSLQVGTTDDWAYFGCFPNTNTGLTPGQAQGPGFQLVPPPPVSGTTIRITGHGTDSTPDPTYEQIQQTHTGPFTGGGSTLAYQVDTTGGNSGSPIIWEQTGQAIGIHTNAGCSTSGGGSNTGTPITQAQLQAALASPTGICAQGGTSGQFADLGHELTGFPIFTAPRLAACGTLEPASPLTVTLTAFNPNVPGTSIFATLFIGFSQLDAPLLGGVLVPFPDIAVGFPLTMPPSGDIVVDLAGTWPPGVPPGFETFLQAWISHSAALWSALVASNGLSIEAP